MNSCATSEKSYQISWHAFSSSRVVVAFLVSWMCASAVSGALSGDIDGTLTLAQFHEGSWSTNSFAVKVSLDAPHWRISVDGNETHQQTLCNGTEVTWVAYYPQIPKDGPLNTSMLKVFPGTRPVDVRIEEHVWMALLSRPHFENARMPMADVGLCINGAGIFTQAEVARTDVSPRVARWHNERAENSTNITRVEGEFLWITSTNLGSAEVPLRSELQMRLRTPQSATTVPASWSEFTITQIGTLSDKPPYRPKLEGRSVVYDYRRGHVSLRQSLAYDITDGNLPSLGSARLAEVERIAKIVIRNKVSKSRTLILWLGFALISVAFFIPALGRNKNKQKERTETPR